MALRLLAPPLSSSSRRKLGNSGTPSSNPLLRSSSLVLWRSICPSVTWRGRRAWSVMACVKLEEDKDASGAAGEAVEWAKVSAVLFDMDGVLCNSEEASRRAGVDLFAEMGVQVTVEDFIPFMGTGEANFLGGLASVKGVKEFNIALAKKRFFEIYLDKYAKPNSGIGFPGALELIIECKSKGLKVAVASSADRIKIDANLAAAGLSLSMFDAVVSADAFENLKPAPDIFLAASKILCVPPSECIVIEDALAGVQAAQAAQMRCIAVMTTLSESTLKAAAPSLIRKEIGSISIDDILSGGSSYHNAKMHGHQHSSNSVPTSPALLPNNKTGSTMFQEAYSTDDDFFPAEGFLVSRRNVLRFGSLGVAVSCLLFTITNWKVMQYSSPKALWNFLFGVTSPPLKQNEDQARSMRLQQFVNYISDLEASGTAMKLPDFPSKLDWLNSAPLQNRRDLQGKVVLLDFWTYCCINCMHVLPDLEFLERKYQDMPFVVIGVHSAKFDNEKDLEAIRNAVLRYDITHPVVNDGDMYMWRKLGVDSWPTFVIVGPNGKVIAQISGENHKKDLDDLIEAALQYYGKKNMLNKTPIPLSLEKNNDPRLLTSPLKFPGKLAVDVLNNRLFISDSNHNRIVVTDLDGNFIVQVGSTGEEGFHDGNFDDASFNRPQGLTYNAKKNVLYIADTENHALRVVDFVSETVQTLAGNGTKGSDYTGGGKGNIQLLNSPWDVCFDPVNEVVYIAMAGQHQIWEHRTLDGVTRAFSGDGYERNLNGSSSTSTSFAQPSGISLSVDLKEAYIADSESSSIRALDLKTGGSRLLAGGDPLFPNNLFKFGDHDGTGSEVLLQHPLGVLCAKDGQIYFADSYNHKIKMLDLVSGRVDTLAGSGKAGFKDGVSLTAQLSEPSGIAEATNGRFLIADTNNGVIRYLDLNMEQPELRTLELKGVPLPTRKATSLKRLRRRHAADTEAIVIDGGPSDDGKLIIHISVPDGFHFSKEARSKFSVDFDPEDTVVFDPFEGNLSPEGSALLHFKRSSTSASMGRISCKGASMLLQVYYCKEDEVCLYQYLTFEVSFKEVIPNSAPAEIDLPYKVKPRNSSNNLQLSVAS